MKISTRQVGLSKSRWSSVMGVLVALMIVLGNPGTASAQVFISGDIGFGGAFTPSTATSATTFAAASLATADSLDYNGNGLLDNGSGFVVFATDDFASEGLVGTFATLNDFTFNPLAGGGVNALWTAGGFSFALSTISIDTQNANTLSLFGTGIISNSDFDDTAGSWNFTGNAAGGNFVFSAGSGVITTPVPEPEVYAMLAAGLGLMGFVARRRKRYDDAVL